MKFRILDGLLLYLPHFGTMRWPWKKSGSTAENQNGRQGFENPAASVYSINGDAGGHTPNYSSTDRIAESNTDENVERGNWSGRFDFLLSCLGYAVGLGNVWRFPYMCYKNGGAVFLIPYTIFLFFVGLPLFLLDVSLGQFTSSGPLTCWEFAPIFTGIGYGMVIISTLVAVYYNMIIAYAIYYFFASMSYPLRWEGCDHSWNTQDCRYRLPLVNCSSMIQMGDGTCRNSTSFVGLWNESLFSNRTGRRRILPAQEYFNTRVLGLTSSINELGSMRWELMLCLLGAWVIVFFCLIKGIKSSGKVVYFTALFPYAVLLILFFRGVTLDGAADGIIFYVVPKFERLADATVWKDAANQIFFSLSASWGGLITLASYNKFHNNVVRDTLVVAFGNCLTSVFAGFVIFSFIGALAKQLGTPVDQVADKGMGLAFIVYPEAVNTMPGSTLWAILFFAMLITLGLDSQFAMLETVTTSIIDRFPDILRPRKMLVTLAMCICLFILGLPMTTDGGPYILQLMDNYCGGWGILLIGLLECVAIGWVYGMPLFGRHHRFIDDIQTMTGKKPWLAWRIGWQFTGPFFILLIVIFSWARYERATYNEKPFPAWADGLGWVMTLTSIIFFPIIAIKKMVKDVDGTIAERFYALIVPSYKWGPALPQHRSLMAQSLTDVSNFYIDIDKKLRYIDWVDSQRPSAGPSQDQLGSPTKPTPNSPGHYSNMSSAATLSDRVSPPPPPSESKV